MPSKVPTKATATEATSMDTLTQVEEEDAGELLAHLTIGDLSVEQGNHNANQFANMLKNKRRWVKTNRKRLTSSCQSRQQMPLWQTRHNFGTIDAYSRVSKIVSFLEHVQTCCPLILVMIHPVCIHL